MKIKSVIFIIFALFGVLSAAFLSGNLDSAAQTEQTDLQGELSQLPSDSVEISGRVEKIEGNRILINSDESGLLYITVREETEILKNGKEAAITDIKVDSLLKIAHNGIVLKSYPGQINIVYRIVLEA